MPCLFKSHCSVAECSGCSRRKRATCLSPGPPGRVCRTAGCNRAARVFRQSRNSGAGCPFFCYVSLEHAKKRTLLFFCYFDLQDFAGHACGFVRPTATLSASSVSLWREPFFLPPLPFDLSQPGDFFQNIAPVLTELIRPGLCFLTAGFFAFVRGHYASGGLSAPETIIIISVQFIQKSNYIELLVPEIIRIRQEN